MFGSNQPTNQPLKKKKKKKLKTEGFPPTIYKEEEFDVRWKVENTINQAISRKTIKITLFAELLISLT
jgi:hypothetical protein